MIYSIAARWRRHCPPSRCERARKLLPRRKPWSVTHLYRTSIAVRGAWADLALRTSSGSASEPRTSRLSSSN
jgi:hypothetical protein